MVIGTTGDVTSSIVPFCNFAAPSDWPNLPERAAGPAILQELANDKAHCAGTLPDLDQLKKGASGQKQAD